MLCSLNHASLSDFASVCILFSPDEGQNWTLAILNLVLQVKELEAGSDISVADYRTKTSFLEIELKDGQTGADLARKLPHPRILKTHLPIEMYKDQIKRFPNMRIIQTMRNPKDTLVSAFHHYQGEKHGGIFKGTWDQFFELFKQEKLIFGDFFDHNVNWYKFNKDRENSLILKYEDMKKDHRGHVIKIAKFIWCNLSNKVIDTIVEKTGKKNMGQEVNQMTSKMGGWAKGKSQLVRKGEVGDWVNYFSQEQSDYIDAKCKEFLEPLGLTFEYSG